MEINQSRRDFLKTAAIAGTMTALGGALSSCQGQPQGNSSPSTLPEKWDFETEVLVVGSGLAGLSTALAAQEAGAKVLVIEKNDEAHEGGNSKVSANLLFIPGSKENGVAYFKGMNEGHMYDISDEMVETWINGMMENRTWMQDTVGVTLTPVPSNFGMGPELPFLPGAEDMQIYMVNGTMANGALYIPVRDLAKSKKIEIKYNTAAQKLLVDSEGRVAGVKATSDQAEISIKAKKGVVLACGSFEFDEAMKANYLRGPIYGLGNPGNTGDGVKMAQALGADLWHMNNAMGPVLVGFLSDDFKDDYPECLRIVTMSSASYFWSDKHGKRFMNETRNPDHGKGWDMFYYYDGNKGEFPENPCWVIFDQAAFDAGPLGSYTTEKTTSKMSWASWYGKYKWSADNSEELKKGWILKGDTVEELAGKLNMDPSVLTATIERFNTSAEAGTDEEFGRVGIAALKGPFYAISVVGGMVNTQGGPKRNEKAQVLHVDGQPIPRLYSAGECGAIYAWQYQGGGNLGECLCFGRIAGKNAASEESI